MSETRRRRQALLALVATEALATQDDLVAALRRRGFVVSQASVSRDIAALGLVKIDGRWARPPASPAPVDPGAARIRDGVLGIRSAGDHLLVLSTPAGEASPVAIAIDRMGWPGLVGTIAGDDTIFVAVDGSRAQGDVRRRLRNVGVDSRAPRKA